MKYCEEPNITCDECGINVGKEDYCDACKSYFQFEKDKTSIINKVMQLRSLAEVTENTYSVKKLKEIERMIKNLSYES